MTKRLAVLLLCFASIAGAQPQAGVVTRIVDGDTLIVDSLGTVRLIGVDTPESVHPQKPIEAFSRKATAFLTRLALQRRVRIEYDHPQRDRYGRMLAYGVVPSDGNKSRAAHQLTGLLRPRWLVAIAEQVRQRR